MTPHEAIDRLQNRDTFLVEKISKLQGEGRNVY
jgi:hypothetical protein